jgi:DnaK suppressor protein
MRKAIGGAATARSNSGNKQTAVRPATRSTAAAAPAKRGPVTRMGPKSATAAAVPARLSLVRRPVPAVAPAAPAAIRLRTLPAPVASAATAIAPSPAPPSNPLLAALLAKRRELSGNLEDTKFDTLAKMGRVAEDDQAQISHEEFISLQRNSMDYQALRQINAAIERIHTGDYGTCASCEEPISEKRLKAIPWAKYCVVCQDRVQTKGADSVSDSEDEAGESW